MSKRLEASPPSSLMEPFSYQANASMFELPEPPPPNIRSMWQRAQEALRGVVCVGPRRESKIVSFSSSFSSSSSSIVDQVIAEKSVPQYRRTSSHSGVSEAMWDRQHPSHQHQQQIWRSNNIPSPAPYFIADVPMFKRSRTEEESPPHISLRQAWGNDIVRVLFPPEDAYPVVASPPLSAEELFEVELEEENDDDLSEAKEGGGEEGTEVAVLHGNSLMQFAAGSHTMSLESYLDNIHEQAFVFRQPVDPPAKKW